MAKLLLPTLLLFLMLLFPLDDALPAKGLIQLGTALARSVARQAVSEEIKNIISNIVSHFYNRSSSSSGLQAQLRWSNDVAYVVELRVGTPARNISLIVDTESNFVWTDCNISPPPAYYSNQSSTFTTLPCDSPRCQQILDNAACTAQCQYNFSGTRGVLANDTFGFQGSTGAFAFAFGCNKVDPFNLTDSSGFAGLGRGPLSLISQLPYSKFSYCFPDAFNTSLSSYMFFGSYADLGNKSVPINTTSFVKDWRDYYLDLRGISLGAKNLPISPATFQYVANTSGTIIHTFSPLTYLVQQAYDILRKEVISQIGLPVYSKSMDNFGLDLCFNRTSDNISISTMTFHFADADMVLPVHNFLLTNPDASVLCLTMMPSNGSYSILGSLQQQNLQFVYDLHKETLSFRSIRCDQLRPLKSNAK